MGAHTKIIEFYGLPGCGKTTICYKLKESFEEKGYKVGVLPDAANHFSWLSLFYTLTIRDIVLFFRFFILLKKHHVHRNLVISPIRRLLIFRSAKKKNEYDFIFVDHGAAQSIVRALYDTPCPLDILNSSVVKALFISTPVDKYVCCKITPEEAFARVRHRNRKNSGTFDQFPDEQLRIVLDGHYSIFESTDSLLRNLRFNLYFIDCYNKLEDCIEEANSIVF